LGTAGERKTESAPDVGLYFGDREVAWIFKRNEDKCERKGGRIF
jgi:hypothetical protein